jgi:hypothetical protein
LPVISNHSTPSAPPGVLLSLSDDVGLTWEPEFAEEFAQTPFVRHCILAVSILYDGLGAPQTSSPTNTEAISHQIEASRLFRASISEVNKHNWLAVLLFTSAVAVFHFNSTRYAHDDGVAEILLALRSAAVMGKEVGPWLFQSRFGLVIRMISAETAAPPSDTSDTQRALDALSLLSNVIEGSDISYKTKEICQHALAMLREWVRSVNRQPKTWMDLFWWPAAVRDDYVSLVAQNDPASLTIFLHWCAAMRNAPNRWFLQGWVEAVGAAVIKKLPIAWLTSLNWAMSIVSFHVSGISQVP